MASPLFEAIINHNYEDAQQLIKNGADIYRRENFIGDALTPLELLEQLNTFSPHNTPLITAQQVERKSQYESFRAFLEEQLLNTLMDRLSKTYEEASGGGERYTNFSQPFQYYLHSIHLLMEKNPMATDKNGWNIFHFLATTNNVKLLMLLKSQLTPEVFKKLINERVKPFLFTPLMIAIDNNNHPMARAIIRRQASLVATDYRGARALQRLEHPHGINNFCRSNEELRHEIAKTRELLLRRESKNNIRKEKIETANAVVSSHGLIEEALENNATFFSNGWMTAENKSTRRFKTILRRIENTQDDLEGIPEVEFNKLLNHAENGADVTVRTVKNRNFLHYLHLLGSEKQQIHFRNAVSQDSLEILRAQEDKNGKKPSELPSVRVQTQANVQANLHDAIQAGNHALAIGLIMSGVSLKNKDDHGRSPLAALVSNEDFYTCEFSNIWQKYKDALDGDIKESYMKILDALRYGAKDHLEFQCSSHFERLNAWAYFSYVLIPTFEGLEKINEDKVRGSIRKLINALYRSLAVEAIVSDFKTTEEILYRCMHTVLDRYKNDFKEVSKVSEKIQEFLSDIEADLLEIAAKDKETSKLTPR